MLQPIIHQRANIRISITNLAERHLRLGLLPRLSRWFFHLISITNLAERHLRPSYRYEGIGVTVLDINHESSRKAFETRAGFPSVRPPTTTNISITNLAERHLRHSYVRHSPGASTRIISITNLAERHLRPRTQPQRRPPPQRHINHESSRKAFETCIKQYFIVEDDPHLYQSRI